MMCTFLALLWRRSLLYTINYYETLHTYSPYRERYGSEVGGDGLACSIQTEVFVAIGMFVM